MTAIEVLFELRRIEDKYKDVQTPTGGIRISDMAKDSADTIESLLDSQGSQRWIPVTEGLPDNSEYGWVLIQTKLIPGGMYRVPHVAELRDGKWYIGHLDGPLEEICGVEVTHWMPLPSIPVSD